ncbi:MAG: tyrosine-type recombinase/integrase [Candidatus Brocadiaceae bacterium]|nr:tyrosine-type recombinase/integrase [Candidatus Brocadiaceae bacterium]
MAVRYRKYFSMCKDIPCTGKRNKSCPETPKKKTGQYKSCGVWSIEFFDDNNKWQALTFKGVTTKTEAEKRYALFISDRERGQLNLPKRQQIPTLREYCEVYIALYRNGKENTIASRKRAIKALTSYLGEYRLDNLTSFIVEKYRLYRKEKGIRDTSINIDIGVLSHILNTAKRDRIIRYNPCADVSKYKSVQAKDRVLSGAEISLLFDKLLGKDRLMILTALFTGMRLNEVLSLKWDDINFQKGVVTYTPSKTGKTLTVPLSKMLQEELLSFKDSVASDRVFEGSQIVHRIVAMYSKHFGKLFKSLGIDNFTFHNLRHTFSSIMQAELGVGAVVVQGFTGHSSLSMLQKYSHSGIENRKAAIGLLTDYVLSLKKVRHKYDAEKIANA